MPKTIEPIGRREKTPTFYELWEPIRKILEEMTPLKARGARPLQMNFEDQLKCLIFYHLEEHTSGRHLLQVLTEDDFARKEIAPLEGIKKSSFFEAINSRGLEQLFIVFKELYSQSQKTLAKEYDHLGDLVSIDGSLIDAVLSMHWADYRTNSKKAKVHLGFDLNRAIPYKIFLTNGKGKERSFVSQILEAGQTGVTDRGYQCHKDFDLLQEEGKHFVCRIKKNTNKICLENNKISEESIVFYDSIVQLGTPGINQTKKQVRVVAYIVDGKEYWIATDRFDLSAENIALIYKLRWDIEKFFAWWKRHLKVYHLIARSEYGLMTQILSGLITYLLLTIYCHNNYKEKVSIKRVRELRIQIQNESRQAFSCNDFEKSNWESIYAKT